MHRSSRDRKTSTQLKDYVCNTVWQSKKCYPPYAYPICIVAQGISLYPLTNYLTCDKFSDKYKHLLASVTTDSEPTRDLEAVSNLKWREPMQQEI